MRRVKQRDALPPQRERNPDLLRDRVIAGGLDHGPEVLAERSEGRGVRFPAQQHELRPLIDPCEMPQQIADVRADAEVMQLARVDADPHGHMILVRDLGLGIWDLLRFRVADPVRDSGLQSCAARIPKRESRIPNPV